MKAFRLPLAILALGLGVPVAAAADLYSVPISSNSVGVPVSSGDSGGFDWDGFYAGIYGVAQQSPDHDTQLGLGLDLGVNAQFDFFLVGAEVAIQGLSGDTFDTAYGQVLGRAGLVVSDQVMIYAAAGLGTDLTGSDEFDALLGGGVELAVTEDVTLGAQYLHGFDLEGDNPKDQVTVGAKFHF